MMKCQTFKCQLCNDRRHFGVFAPFPPFTDPKPAEVKSLTKGDGGAQFLTSGFCCSAIFSSLNDFIICLLAWKRLDIPHFPF